MAVVVDGEPIVVRASELHAVRRLEERFAPHLGPHPGTEARVSLAVSVSEDRRRSTNSVHCDGWPVRSTHSFDSALDTVERLLLGCSGPPSGTSVVHARVLERDGRAVLVSDVFREALDGHHRRIAAAGFTDGLVSGTRVDPVTAEALVPAGTLDAPAWRRLPIGSVVAFAPAADAESPAVRVTHFTPLIVGRSRPTTAADVQALVDLMARVPFVRFDFTAHRQVADALVALATG